MNDQSNDTSREITRPTGSYSADFSELLHLLWKGARQTLGLAFLGVIVASVVYLIATPLIPNSTSTRVTFSFEGFNRGEYPDHSKFQPDDLRAPDIITSAMRNLGIDSTNELQTKIRAGIAIEPIIPLAVVKERDRLRAAGQTVPPYISDEYDVTLTLPREVTLPAKQRRLLLEEIINAYKENFQRTFADVPLSLGSTFAELKGADLSEYEFILNTAIDKIISYLQEKRLEDRLYRSPTTNLSFGDLIDQTRIFAELRVYDVLGPIRKYGLSENREASLVRIAFDLHDIQDREDEAVADQSVISDLLTQAQNRAQSYVLGVKTQSNQPRSETPLLDQGLIESLLANDSYNMLVRRAIDEGMAVKRIQAEKAKVLERKKILEDPPVIAPGDRLEMIAKVRKATDELTKGFDELISKIRKTNADYARQKFGNAVSISSPVKTEGFAKPLIIASAIGFFLGFSGGIGLSLLGIFLVKWRET